MRINILNTHAQKERFSVKFYRFCVCVIVLRCLQCNIHCIISNCMAFCAMIVLKLKVIIQICLMDLTAISVGKEYLVWLC